jgi:hypothetical protein
VAGPTNARLNLRIVDQAVEIVCDDPAATNSLRENYAALLHREAKGADLRYRVSTEPSTSGFLLHRHDGRTLLAANLGELVFHLEKAIIVALQECRPDLLFLHAAALERDRAAWLFVGESGAGKSTTAWGLLHHGFNYLSDELAPIDLDTLEVFPYPHALCLKRRPPPPYQLPVDSLDLGRTIRVPARSLPSLSRRDAYPLKAVFFVSQDARLHEPVLCRVSTAEAAARLYASTLNALAHDARGLDAVLRVAGCVSCFVLQAGDLERTCELIAATGI